jgi:bifunctional DNA-binding transcriptional regulator/antitoxin component of YhaV-PrlF toxin-antitoxin module
MTQRVEVELDDQGRLIVPHHLQQQLGLFSGATVVVEDETDEVAYVRLQPEQPRLINKDGVLVVQALPLRDFTTMVRDERERHMADMLRRGNL